jgi:predicted esterase YcpF (UPF0227 family)|tara:strand:- start:992 stop:1537 length:546 start_codon:yes stop_codon:yes gene_type:complete
MTAKKTKRIIYFSGLQRGKQKKNQPRNPKILALEAAGYQVVGMPTSADYKQTLVSFNLLRSVIALDDTETYVIGTSLGGYWAYRFGKETNLPTILINPQLNPHYYPARDIDDLFKADNRCELTVLLTEDDDIIPYQETLRNIEHYDIGCQITTFAEGGHRFITPESTKYLVDLVDNYVPCL